MRKRLLVDVDEVLADFQTPMFDALYDLYGRRLTPEDCDVWDCFSCMTPYERKGVFTVISSPGWATALKPLPGSQEGIKKLREIVDIYAVTRHFETSHTWVHERDEWLKKHFDFTGKDVIHTSAKYLVKADAFLDDNPDHLTKWLAEHPGGLAMLWHIPNTRLLPYDDLRVRSWDEVIDRVRALAA
jgi:5'(3')-deoxyribonucleotidase